MWSGTDKEADKRVHLDPRVNLLAECELTAILRILCSLADHMGVDLQSTELLLAELRRRPTCGASLTISTTR